MLEPIRRVAAKSILHEVSPHYRTAIGVLGIALPPVLLLIGAIRGVTWQGTISAYYHTAMRDIFVGIHWVIGVFLFFYIYHPQDRKNARSETPAVRSGELDAWLGKAAGLSAVIVALFPTNPPPDSPVQPPTIGMIHGVAAAVLFLCLSMFPLKLFSQSRGYESKYRSIGYAMLAVLATLAIYQFSPKSVREALAGLRPVFWLETILILLFGWGWFAKGRELAKHGREKPGRRTAA
jgi:hypothetical protein